MYPPKGLYMPVFYRLCRHIHRRCLVTTKESLEIAKIPSEIKNGAPPETAGETLRVTGGKLSLFTPKVDELPSDMEPLASRDVPVIDKSSFKNYLIVPQLGIKSLFSSQEVKLCENSPIPYKEYVPGTVHAHHYPLFLLPTEYSARISSDIYAASYTEDSRNYKFEGDRRLPLSIGNCAIPHPPQPLLYAILGRPTLLLLFSGNPPNSDATTALLWKNRLEHDINTVAVLNSPSGKLLSFAHKRYLNTLASTIVDKCLFMSIVKSLSVQSTVNMHQYRKELPSLLLIDKSGYIRWHAIGKPTRESSFILNESIKQVLKE
ncbi:hypothetical protein BEWA_050520 [Theileria equi strain WA]|uniref:Uncharacterized protein n=1 Tax=Theileria equi strain WA TaxID=1537102 RepID=L1LBD7_THEEQ|nr:hypothetical protein BEWA_050520 [Theileria equi strain WA]EKX72584.1 hypothetical protein BEWA_050520 [Theileria equi strain WA]|eukprot:XP_004832036.1 hypothetical protein BEWA_050520 [Theileria equi strain WA]